jgi:hypothetical protein
MTTRPIPSPGDWPLSDPGQDLHNSYIEWREVAADAADAYRRWANAPLNLRARRFAEYRAALDEEEFAAICYGLAVMTVERQQERGHRTR